MGLSGREVQPDPLRIAQEGALWGAIVHHGLLRDSVILSDDAGQFKLARHALCWIHAERLIHKLDAFCERQRRAKERIRRRIWWLYADLKAYRERPGRRRRSELSRRFNQIFSARTGFATLDRLLAADPGLARAAYEKGEILHWLGLEESGDAWLRHASRLDPYELRGQIRWAVIELASGRVAEARSRVERLLQIDPDCSPCAHVLGEVELRSGDVESARRRFVAVAPEAPEPVEAPEPDGKTDSSETKRSGKRVAL